MLITLSSTRDKNKVLREFNPENSLWITSDIKSRLSILSQLNQTGSKKNYVLRAADFWSGLFSRVFPEHHIVPRPFLTLLYQKWAKHQKHEWQKRKETGLLICRYMEILAHLLKHPMKNDLMKEWSESWNQPHYMKWHNLTCAFWDYLKEKKIMESSWACAFLIDNSKATKELSHKELVFDLGFNINTLEKELILQISKKIPTKALAPFYFKELNKNEIYSIYKELNAKQNRPVDLSAPLIKKFNTPLAEVKDITNQVAGALKRGIKPHKVSVLAPRIEDYWTCLKSHFERENIPVNKTETLSLQSFPLIQLWFAQMQTHLGILKYENLDTLSAKSGLPVNFSRLKADFYHVRQDWPKQLFHKNKIKTEPISLGDFIKWAFDFLPPKPAPELVQKALTECRKELSQKARALRGMKFTPLACLNLLEHFIKKKEIEIQPGNPQGINCLSFNALSRLEPDFTCIMGLSEQNMKTKEHAVISSFSAASLKKNLGFFIKSEPMDKWEQTIYDFIHRADKTIVLSFSSTDFSGIPLNPSRLWLEQAVKHKKEISFFDSPELTSWDKQQRKSSIKEILTPAGEKRYLQDPNRWRLMEEAIQEDLSRKTPKPFAQKEIQNLSPSSLDSYIKCPFVFSAKNIFRLWDGPQRDTDIPPTQRGSMVHSLFEALKSQKKQPVEEDILKMIEDIKANKKFKTVHPVIWEKEKSYLLKKALIFLQNENKRKSVLKNRRTIACEKEYSCCWNLNTKSPAKKGDITFKGTIDRIDSGNKSYQITDYKNNLPSGAVAPAWTGQNNFQMALYTQVIEEGLTDLPPLPVESALYLSYKNFEYQGLALNTPEYIHLLNSPKKKSLISEEQKKDILREANKKINTFILKIREGRFPAEPQKKSLCEKCRWRKICRARHLN